MADSPVLVELRSDVEGLAQIDGNDSVSDGQHLVLSLCKTLESAFRHGLLRETKDQADFFDVILTFMDQQNSLGRPKGCANPIPILICKSINFICSTKCLFSSKSRGRLLIRCGLNGQWLSIILEALQNWSDIDGYYREDALLRSNQRLFSLLQELKAKVKFQLDLENFAFLDLTWERPIFLKHDLVPCKDLGLMVCSIEGHIIVTKVKPYSVAGEDDKIEVGDNLISIDGVILFDLSPDFIAKMIKKLGGKVPINLSVGKARGPKARIYPPLEPILHIAGLNVQEMEANWQKIEKLHQWRHGRSYSCPTNDLLEDLVNEQDKQDEESESESTDGVFETSSKSDLRDLFMAKSGYHLTYLGSLQVGKVGDTTFLDSAIRRVMNDPSKIEHNVSLHLLELGIRLYCRSTAKLVLSYPYPKISACGCNTTDARYVAFIGGDNLCSLAENFLCHVFYAEDVRIAREIVGHMANGFDRTVTTA